MLNRYLEIKKQMDALDAELDEIKAKLFVKADFAGKASTTLKLDGYKVRIQQKENVTVDQEKAKRFPHLFKTKYEFNSTIFNTLNPMESSMVKECITTKAGKPSFTVEKMEE